MRHILKVLIVDDDELLRKALAKGVTRALGNMPDEAGSAEEAWEKIQLDLPDILVTDTNMGPMSGIDLIRLVSCCYPHVQTISLFDGLHGSSIDAADVLRMGAAAVLNKKELNARLIPELKAAAWFVSLLSSIFSRPSIHEKKNH